MYWAHTKKYAFRQVRAYTENTDISLSLLHKHTHTCTHTGRLAKATHMAMRDTLGKVGRVTVTFDSQSTSPQPCKMCVLNISSIALCVS